MLRLIALSMLGLMACGESAEEPMPALVTTEWLSERLNDPDLVVLDCSVLVEFDEDGAFRTVSGRANYDGGHIPTAGFADLTTDLADANNPLPFSLPAPEEFRAVMEELGVGDDTRVVLYSAGSPAWAARVWWMLRWIGFDRAGVLDGGLEAWVDEGRPLSTEPADRPVARKLTSALRPELIADRDQVFAAIDDDAVNLVDAMPEDYYRGEVEGYHGRRGHIPSAINIPASSLVDESGHYRQLEELADIHRDDRNTRAITYCGGGISASSNAFIMVQLGFTDVAVYIGSLQEWAADPANPLVVALVGGDM